MITSAAVSTFVVLRIMGAADFDVDTARAILLARGTTDVAIGGLVSLVFFVAPPGVLVATWVVVYRARRRGWDVLHMVTLMMLFLVAFVLMPLINLLLLVLGVVTAAGLGARHRSVARDRARSEYLPLLTLFAAMPLTLLAVANTLWLPTEAVTVADRPPVTGYVLRDDAEPGAILWDHPRKVEYLARADVKARTLCSQEQDWWWRTPASLRRETGAAYPRCPKALGR